MIRKDAIVYLFFTVCLLYIISPWFFARNLFFNEIISLGGFFVLASRRFRISNDPVSICVILLVAWSVVHIITSLPRMDTFYFYLRNLVIVYSIMAFFAGFYCFPYLDGYIKKIRGFLQFYIGIFIFIQLPRYLFERFGMAMLFPALFRRASSRWMPLILILLNLIYGFSYNSFTILVLTAFLILLFFSPGYKFFKQVLFICFILFAAVFIYLQPNLSLISKRYTPYNEVGIHDVINSHPLLGIDGNNTWRLELWKEIIVDNFPANLFGLGFGTPALKYFPVEDISKIPTLPYVLGGHNSFVYLFGRLGIVYVVLMAIMYMVIFKEYFRNKDYYIANNQELVFLSFFSISVIALFNTVLESPIYASAYWLILGFTARCISDRKKIKVST